MIGNYSVRSYSPHYIYPNGYMYPLYNINTSFNNNTTVAQPIFATNPKNIPFKSSDKLQNKHDKRLSTGAKIAIGTGITLAMAIGADFVFFKGRYVKNMWNRLTALFKTPVKGPQNVPETNVVDNFDKVVSEFKSKHKEFSDVEPIITKLKNGKTKIEFKTHIDGMDFDKNTVLVFNKNGSFERLIDFKDYGESFKQYISYKDIGMIDFEKSCDIKKRKEVVGNLDIIKQKIHIEKPYEKDLSKHWHHDIDIAKSSNMISVRNYCDGIPYGEQKGSDIITTVNLKNGIYKQQKINHDTPKFEKTTDKFKLGKRKKVLPEDAKIYEGLTQEEVSIVNNAII